MRWSLQIRSLRNSGKAGVVKEGNNAKTDNCGTEMMFVGYPFNRESDSVRLWNPGTNRVCTPRDVIWMKQMYYKKIVSEMKYVDKEVDDAAEESMNDSDSDSGLLVESKAGKTMSDTLVTTT